VFHRDPRQVTQQRLADTVAAVFEADVQVFKVKPRAGEKGREVEEVERESNRLILDLRQNALDHGPWTKERLPHQRLRSHDLVQEFLVFGQLADESQDGGDVGGRGRHDVYRRHGSVLSTNYANIGARAGGRRAAL